MAIRNSILLGTLGRYADRFHQFQKPRSLAERLDLATTIPRTHGVEPVYPQDLGYQGEHVDLVKASGLAVSAVNVNVKSEDKFRAGSFTNPDAGVRREATQYLKTAMDLASDLGADMITVCPLIDGWDYAFQVDFRSQWRWLVEAFSEASAYRSDVKISIEYKAYESRNRIILPSMGRTLHFCNTVGADTLGVTIDVGHALIAGETPAAEICLAHDAGRLFYIHFNDNNRGADWDMLPASVNFWETLEALFYMRELGWDGWVAYDVFTRHGADDEAIASTFQIMEDLDKIIDRIGMDQIRALRTDGTPARTFAALTRALV
ncbi:sugar phosphate isomerase/epimerase family protein [Pelagibacterium luteolum]|uniref:Xylose isomerase n=1 Tax=Pelagibacterium luteolum TaxID=440168 RepID=A0A1G7YEJ3_9HYPH|nr:sugar phosphate isomerase/epimerase family protein [Pelagibacterium luteolum]SDG94739.1 xylose isomerase [Pelagibacterium luteolum]